jgi:hypothetical protein
MKKVFRITPFVALALAMVFGPTGCGHSNSGDSMGSSESVPGFTKADREAESAGIAELQRHWLKGPDGWTTAIVSGTPYAPDHFLRQCRALTVDEVKPDDLSESDKLNGFEWTGQLTFKRTSCREGGGQEGLAFNGMSDAVVNKHPGRWSQWVDFTPGPMRFQKQRGRWQFQWDGSYLRGTLPGPQDFANAGVH